jgi:transposase
MVLSAGAGWPRRGPLTFSENRHGHLPESDLLREVFETVLRRCIREGPIGGEGFAVDASLIKANARLLQ